jgi:hypothetical protein
MAQFFRPIQNIIILEQPPEYAFPGEWLELALTLDKDATNIPSSGLALQTSVHFHDEQVPMGQAGDLSFAKLVSTVYVIQMFILHLSEVALDTAQILFLIYNSSCI